MQTRVPVETGHALSLQARIHAPFVASLVSLRNAANWPAGKNVAKQFGQMRKFNSVIAMRIGSDLKQKEQSMETSGL
jgi:hypothetical protein